MTDPIHRAAARVAWLLALVALLGVDALAQPPGTAASAAPAAPAAARSEAPKPRAEAGRTGEDMRLWSFGDCTTRFPYVETSEYKECVRVVGSQEAKDARAYHFCQTSHAKDPAEVVRCKAAYDENRKKATQVGLVPNAPAQPQEPLPPEVIERVRAIETVAVEQDRAAAAGATDPGAAPPPPATPIAVGVDAAAAQPAAGRPAASSAPDLSSLAMILAGLLAGIVIFIVAMSVLRRRKSDT